MIEDADLLMGSLPKRGTYSSRIECRNCGVEERIDIPKGQVVAETPCPRCECLSIRRVTWSLP